MITSSKRDLTPGEYSFSELSELLDTSRTTVEKFEQRHKLTKTQVERDGKQVAAYVLTEEDCTTLKTRYSHRFNGDVTPIETPLQQASISHMTAFPNPVEPHLKPNERVELQDKIDALDKKIDALQEKLRESEGLRIMAETKLEATEEVLQAKNKAIETLERAIEQAEKRAESEKDRADGFNYQLTNAHEKLKAGTVTPLANSADAQMKHMYTLVKTMVEKQEQAEAQPKRKKGFLGRLAAATEALVKS